MPAVTPVFAEISKLTLWAALVTAALFLVDWAYPGTEGTVTWLARAAACWVLAGLLGMLYLLATGEVRAK